MRKACSFKKTSTLAVALLAASVTTVSQAYTLIDEQGKSLNLDVEAVLGIFSSDESYGSSEDKPSWSEGYIKYGLSAQHSVGSGEIFGAVNALSSGTWGDGDAAGLTTGDERETDIEDMYAGYRNNMFEISFGRQNITIGDGFILNGDGLNMGKGLDGIMPGFSANRGGAYWLAGRKALDKTAMLRVGGESGPRADLFWFESDNPAQASVEMAGLNFEYVTDTGTFGLMHLKGLDVDDNQAAFLGYGRRDGQKTTSIRYQGNAGVENLFLSAEYVDQSQGNSNPDANAWYVEAGWTFVDLPWSPSANYRYTSYDQGYDPLLFGFNRGYGTWFQGEVAANYAGPFATDSDIHYLGIKANPTEMLTVGASYFDFSDTVGGSGSNDASEIDIWAEWVAHDHLIISPLVGFYTPDSDSSTQGNDDTNIYMQVLAIVPF